MAYLQGANNRKMIGKNKRRNTTIIIAVGFNKMKSSSTLKEVKIENLWKSCLLIIILLQIMSKVMTETLLNF